MNNFYGEDVIVIVDRFADLPNLARKGMQLGLTAAATSIMVLAKQKIQSQNMIDTGALFNSIYVQSPDIDGRETALALARAAAAVPGIHSNETHDAPEALEGKKAVSGLIAKVGAAMEYAPYLELGTERAEQRPFMKPSVEEMRPKIGDIVAEYVRAKLGE